MMVGVATNGSFRVRRVSNDHRSAVLHKALSAGKGVRITKGQGNAIVGGKSYRSAVTGRYVESSTSARHPKTTVGESRRGLPGKGK